jgi:single-stranded-DNA-specific exonuclease
MARLAARPSLVGDVVTDRLQIHQREIRGDGAALGHGLHPVVRRVYAARGLNRPEELQLSLERLAPVSSLEGVADAAQLLRAHRDGLILIIGDYDADGATSTALMLRALRGFGFPRAEFLVPNRFEFGYGLSPEIVALAAERRPSLIVTVDNGISSAAGVRAAVARGIEVLITDHHLPSAELPAAQVIVNPNLAGSAFASRALAGVGVAFYVMTALRHALQAAGELPAQAPPMSSLLDLVALGTVADVVPLDANNRILVAQGLARIRAGRCVPGITALLQLARRSPAELTAGDLGFAVAPRLNAAGRLTDMSIGIRCLLCDEAAEAQQLAAELDALNVQRRGIEASMQEQALLAVRSLLGPTATTQRAGVCLFDPNWHQGVVGLVASRIKERLRRPVVAFARADDGTLRGSARSVPGVHVRDVLDAIATRAPKLLEKFGGHAMAAGLTLAEADLDEFARAFDAEVAQWLARCGSPDLIETDGPLSEAELALETAEALRAAGPWGAGFAEPLFDGVFAVESGRIVGDRHLKLRIGCSEGRGSLDAIAFNFLQPGAPESLPVGRMRVVYRLGTNDYQGSRRLQLVIEHVLPV